ncbi:MAG: cytochrome c family protein [Myxococcaceae bacterium]|nr:cytochrome c family protein [Myxococcaceae bacterium]
MGALPLLVALLAANPGPPTDRAVLYLSADMRGYLAPCGCSENMRGGVARAAHQLAEARRQGPPVLYVDGGNSLFGAPRLTAAQVPQDEARARALAGAMKAMGLVTRATGPLDDARGEAFLRSLGLPNVAFGRGEVLAAGTHRVGVVSARDAAELRAGAAEARRKGAELVLGLLQRTVEDAQALAARTDTGVDLLVATFTASETSGEENRLVRGAVPLVGLQSKGRSLLRVEVAFGEGPGPFQLQRGQADVERELSALDARIALLDREVNHPGLSAELRRLKLGKLEELVRRRLTTGAVPDLQAHTYTLRFVPLEASLPSDPAVAAIVARYDAEVGRLNLAWARVHGKDCPAPAKGQAAFVGNKACRGCHAGAFAVYEASKHAHAWETLVGLGKQHHLQCASCHVTGWEQPGGVCRIDRTARREDVGCESCHGPGSLHARAPAATNIVGRPGAAACTGCHTLENSPHFDFTTYVPRILGPGHGAAAPRVSPP